MMLTHRIASRPPVAANCRVRRQRCYANAFAVVLRTHLHEAYLERRMHRPWRKRGS